MTTHRDRRSLAQQFGLPAEVSRELGLHEEGAFEKFVPYLYLDGHRSGGHDDADPYEQGVRFAILAASCAWSAACTDVVFMVRTDRNRADAGRMTALDSSLRAVVESPIGARVVSGAQVRLYGPATHRSPLAELAARPVPATGRTIHLLDGYSEEWAARSGGALETLPGVSAVVRFTKGHLGGGWLPARMNDAAFVYAQTPSRAADWSEDGVRTLLAIMARASRLTRATVGTKVYGAGEMRRIRARRDEQLSMTRATARLNPTTTRVISFDPTGPTVYEF